MPRITPFLWFDKNAEDAARFYTSIFPNSKMGKVSKYSEGGPGPAGTVLTAAFELDGQPFIALNGGPQFSFNESVSFVVDCANQEEIDSYWSKLTADGGQESMCGWLKDRFGLSWQVVPAEMGQLVSGPHAARVMEVLMKMKKLDLAALRQAAGGG